MVANQGLPLKKEGAILVLVFDENALRHLFWFGSSGATWKGSLGGRGKYDLRDVLNS